MAPKEKDEIETELRSIVQSDFPHFRPDEKVKEEHEIFNFHFDDKPANFDVFEDSEKP